MMRTLLLPILLVAGLFSALAEPTRASDDSRWLADLGPALAQARAEGKDVLVDFTGSDWCGWCIRLHDEVFSKDEFLEYAAQHYVLVALDFPRQGGAAYKAMSEGLRARNAREAKVFAVQGYPTILLMSADGDVYGRTGYQKGGPVAYREHLEALRSGARRGELAEQRELLRKGDESERLAAAYALHDETWSGGRAALLDVVRELDPQDSRGLLLGRLRDLVDAGVANASTDWKAVVGEGRALAVSTPALLEKPLYHALLGMSAVRARDADVARACLERLDVLGGVQPKWLDDFREDVEELGAK